MGANGKIVALALLLADVEQSDPGLAHLQHISAVDISQQGELVQVGGLAIHVGSDVENQHWLSGIFGGKQGSDGGPVDAGQSS